MAQINGKQYQTSGKSLAKVLQELEYDFRTIAVEVNEEIIPKKDYDTTSIKEDDVVEVVSFVGGG